MRCPRIRSPTGAALIFLKVSKDGQAGLAQTRYWLPGLLYLLAYGLALYRRIPISDWLTTQTPF